MKLILPSSGKLAQIRVKYTTDEPASNKNRKNTNDSPYIRCRGAHIRLTIDGFLGGIEAEARSVCKPPDQFSRQTAKKFAIKHLLDKVGYKLSNVDCEYILKSICPPKPTYNDLRKENNRLKKEITRLLTERGNNV